MYNKNNLAVAQFAAPSKIKPELAAVLFTGTHTVATDGFRIIEVSAPEPDTTAAPQLLDARNIRDVKATQKDTIALNDDGTIVTPTATYSPRSVAGAFPNYKMLLDEKTAKPPVLKLRVNARYLAELTTLMAKLNTYGSIDLTLYGEREPILLETPDHESTTQPARALLMPVNW